MRDKSIMAEPSRKVRERKSYLQRGTTTDCRTKSFRRKDRVKESLGNALSGSLHGENDHGPTIPPRRCQSGEGFSSGSGGSSPALSTSKSSKHSKKASATLDDPFIDALFGAAIDSQTSKNTRKERKSKQLWKTMGLEKFRKEKGGKSKKDQRSRALSPSFSFRKSSSVPASSEGKKPRRSSMGSLAAVFIPKNRSEQPGSGKRFQMQRRSTMDHGSRMTRRDYQPSSPVTRRRSMDHYNPNSNHREYEPRSPMSSSVRTEPIAECTSRSPSSATERGNVPIVPMVSSQDDAATSLPQSLSSTEGTAQEVPYGSSEEVPQRDSFFGLDLDSMLEAELRDEASVASQSSKVSKAYSEPDIPSPLKKLEARRRLRRTRSKDGLDSGSYHGSTHTSRRNASNRNKMIDKKNSGSSKARISNIPPPPPMSAPLNRRKSLSDAPLSAHSENLEISHSTSLSVDARKDDWASLDLETAISKPSPALKPTSQASLSDPVAMSRVVGENLMTLGADLIIRGRDIKVSCHNTESTQSESLSQGIQSYADDTLNDADDTEVAFQEEEMELEVELGVGISLDQQITKLREENGGKLPMTSPSFTSNNEQAPSSSKKTMTTQLDENKIQSQEFKRNHSRLDDSWRGLEFGFLEDSTAEIQKGRTIGERKNKIPKARSSDDLDSIRKKSKTKKKALKKRTQSFGKL